MSADIDSLKSITGYAHPATVETLAFWLVCSGFEASVAEYVAVAGDGAQGILDDAVRAGIVTIREVRGRREVHLANQGYELAAKFASGLRDLYNEMILWLAHADGVESVDSYMRRVGSATPDWSAILHFGIYNKEVAIIGQRGKESIALTPQGHQQADVLRELMAIREQRSLS